MRSIVCILLVLYVSSAFGAVWTGVYDDPKYPGKCTINDQLILSRGETAKDPNQACGRIICQAEGVANFASCGVVVVPSDCKLGDYVNADLPYPECCKRHMTCTV